MTPVPYLASAGWYAKHLAGVCQGHLPAPDTADRHPNRTLISGPSGELTLSVPLAGGRRAALSPQPALLSMHGGWPRIHTGALAAAYGRTPYFEHYLPLLIPLYENLPQTLDQLCLALHDIVCTALHLTELSQDILSRLNTAATPAVLTQEDARLSVLHLLFHQGPSALLTLIEMHNRAV